MGSQAAKTWNPLGHPINPNLTSTTKMEQSVHQQVELVAQVVPSLERTNGQSLAQFLVQLTMHQPTYTGITDNIDCITQSSKEPQSPYCAPKEMDTLTLELIASAVSKQVRSPKSFKKLKTSFALEHTSVVLAVGKYQYPASSH